MRNIVYFVGDQLRSDAIHYLGNESAITPHLDKLCEESVSFKNAYCQNPVCVPSRCSFLSGLYPHTMGHRTMHYLQSDQEPNILKTMKEKGYEVIWCGRNDVYPSDKSKLAYCDEYYDGRHQENRVDYVSKSAMEYPKKKKADTSVDGYYSFYLGDTSINDFGMHTLDVQTVQSAVSYLKRKQKEGNKKPFFLYVTLMFPHPPYGCPKPYYGTTNRENNWTRRSDLIETTGKPSMLHTIHEKQSLHQWNSDKWNELRATYLDMVNFFDTQFGILKSSLEKNGFDEETSIFVFSDHGDYTGDYGIVEKVQNCFDDPVSKVPLIIRPSKDIDYTPRISDALIELTDLAITTADIAEVSLNYTQFGISAMPLLKEEREHRSFTICEGGRLHGETQCMEKGHDESSQYWPRLSAQESEGPEHTKAIMIRNKRYKYVYRMYEDDELYDLEHDANEMNNLIHEERYAAQIMNYKLKLLDFMIATSDYVPNKKDKR